MLSSDVPEPAPAQSSWIRRRVSPVDAEASPPEILTVHQASLKVCGRGLGGSESTNSRPLSRARGGGVKHKEPRR